MVDDGHTRLRILMLGPASNQTGGVVDFVRMLNTQLCQRHEVVSVHVGRDGSSLPTVLRVLRDAWRLGRTLQRVRPDVVQLNPSMNRAALRELLHLAVIAVFHRSVVVIFNHGWHAEWPGRIARSPILGGLARLACRAADRLYVLSEKARADVLAWGVPADRVLATSTMCDTAVFVSEQRGRSHAAVGSPVQLLFLSRLVPGKGAAELIHAFATLVTVYPHARLVVAGDGPARDQMVALARAVAPHADIQFPGFVSGQAKVRLMVESDLFVFPSHLSEGFPVSLLEAMAGGMPVLASAVGGVVDLFAKGACGEALSARPSADELVEVLSRWLAQPGDWPALGAANHRLAVQHYDCKAWSRRLEADYLMLLQQRGLHAH